MFSVSFTARSQILVHDSRAETIPIDAIGLQFEMLPSSSYAKPPALGVYVYGFFFEGARWDEKQSKLLYYESTRLGEGEWPNKFKPRDSWLAWKRKHEGVPVN